MGPNLAGSSGSELDSDLITARLWGNADIASWRHGGPAFTLIEAVESHGGGALFAADAFAALPDMGKEGLLALLRPLRTPLDAAPDL